VIRGLFAAEAVASTVATATVTAEFEAQGAAAVVAAGEVTVLRSALLGLAGIGAIEIPIAIVGAYGLKKLMRHEGKVLGQATTIGGPDPFPDKDRLALAYKAQAADPMKGGGFNHTLEFYYNHPGWDRKRINRNTSGMSNDPVHDAAGRAADGNQALPPPPPPTYRKSFELPYALRVAAANASLTKQTGDDVAVAKRIVAAIEALKKAGRLKGQALLDALADESSAMQTIWDAQTSTNKTATKKAREHARAIKNFALPLVLQVAQARADAMASLTPNSTGPTPTQVDLARQVKRAALDAIKSHRLTLTALLDAWNVVGQANQVLAQAGGGKNALRAHFGLSAAFQVRQAKADALAALDPNSNGPTSDQISLAKAAKAAAMHAIQSHKLSMQALIDAWNVVAQSNQVLAAAGIDGQANNYVAVSTSTFTKGLGLSKDQAKTVQERAAQAAAHGGARPRGTATEGVVITGPVHVHGVHDVATLYSQLKKHAKKHDGQRAGQR
jgi:hypothetical protein